MANEETMVARTPIRITKRIVDAAVPDGDKERVIWDSELKGFGVRVRPSGMKSYIVHKRIGRRQFKYTIGNHGAPWTVDTAREQALKAILAAAQTGENPSAKKRSVREQLSVAELIEEYLTAGKLDKPEKGERTWYVEASVLRRHAGPMLGSKPIGSLTPEILTRWQADVVNGKTSVDQKTKRRGRAIVKGGRGIAPRAMGALSAMLSWAVTKGFVVENPALKVQKLPDRRRDRFLTEDEVRRMFDVMRGLEKAGEITPASHDVIMLLALTGARPAEIMGLRWSEIDSARGFATLPADRHKTGKSGEPRIIHFNEAAKDVLKRRPRHTEFVFPDATGAQPIKRVQDAWELIRERADLPGVVLYTLRHSFASFAIDDGESLYVVGRALGHKKAATTERYAHVRDGLAQRVAAGVGAKLTAISRKSERDE